MSVDADTMGLARAMRVELDSHVDDTTRALVEMWSGAWEELADGWSRALADLVSMETGEWPTRAQVLRAERTRRAMSTTEKALRDLSKRSGVHITGAIPDTIAGAQRWVERQAASQLPEGVADWARVDERALRAIVKRTTGQVESALHSLPREQQAVMRQVLIRGVAVGDSPREAAAEMLRRLGGAFDGGRWRAENLARTEMLDAHRQAAMLARQENSDMLAGWRWTCSLSGRTCPACLAMHGRVFPVNQFGPEGHQQCRCTATPVAKSWRDLGIDIDEPPDQFPDAQTWFWRQPHQTQVDIMGAERLDQLRRGQISWDELAVRRENPGWRPSWVPRPVAA